MTNKPATCSIESNNRFYFKDTDKIITDEKKPTQKIPQRSHFRCGHCFFRCYANVDHTFYLSLTVTCLQDGSARCEELAVS